MLARAKLPIRAPGGISTERFLELMAVDKKVMDGKLRLVLLKNIGHAIVTTDFARSALLATLSECRETSTVAAPL